MASEPRIGARNLEKYDAMTTKAAYFLLNIFALLIAALLLYESHGQQWHWIQAIIGILGGISWFEIFDFIAKFRARHLTSSRRSAIDVEDVMYRGFARYA